MSSRQLLSHRSIIDTYLFSITHNLSLQQIMEKVMEEIVLRLILHYLVVGTGYEFTYTPFFANIGVYLISLKLKPGSSFYIPQQ